LLLLDLLDLVRSNIIAVAETVEAAAIPEPKAEAVTAEPAVAETATVEETWLFDGNSSLSLFSDNWLSNSLSFGLLLLDLLDLWRSQSLLQRLLKLLPFPSLRPRLLLLSPLLLRLLLDNWLSNSLSFGLLLLDLLDLVRSNINNSRRLSRCACCC
jgi:hypothetical protein